MNYDFPRVQCKRRPAALAMDTFLKSVVVVLMLSGLEPYEGELKFQATFRWNCETGKDFSQIL